MKCKLFLLLIFLSIFFSSTAQHAEVTKGETFITPLYASFKTFFKDSNEYYASLNQFDGSVSRISVAHFNAGMQLVKIGDFKISFYDEKQMMYNTMIRCGNKFHLFASQVDYKGKKHTLFRQTVNKNTLQSNNDLEKIDEIDMVGKEYGSYKIFVSEDANKVMIVKAHPYDDNSPQKYSVKIFDNTFSKSWETTIELPYKKKFYWKFHTFKIANSGTIYFIAEHSTFNPYAANFKVFSCKQNSELSTYDVSLPGKFINAAKLDVAENGDAIVAGFYTNNGKINEKPTGVFYMKISNSTNSVAVIKEQKFPVSYKKQYSNDRETNAMEVEETELKIDMHLEDVLVRENGKCYMVGENRSEDITKVSANSSNSYMNNATYYYLDVMVVSFQEDGTIEWFEKIPKRQVSSGELSMTKVMYNDKLYFVFLDHEENITKWTSGELENFKWNDKGIVSLVVVDGNHAQTRELLYKHSEMETMADFTQSNFALINEIIIEAGKDKKNQLVRVKLK